MLPPALAGGSAGTSQLLCSALQGSAAPASARNGAAAAAQGICGSRAEHPQPGTERASELAHFRGKGGKKCTFFTGVIPFLNFKPLNVKTVAGQIWH